MLLPLIGCDDTPDYMLDRDEMVALLADIHKGEAMCDIKTGTYRNDSLKKELKYSVFYKHGIDQERFDTIMAWYGVHIEEYGEIYDDVIIALEDEEKRVIADAARAGKSVIEVGDSVNIWVGTTLFTFMPNSTNNLMRFDVKSDDTFEKGDRFEFSFRIFNNRIPANMFMAIDYTDGATSYISKTIDTEDKHSIKLQADTSRVLERVYGYLKYDVRGDNIVFVDSINVARERFKKNQYYRMRLQEMIDTEKAMEMDSIKTDKK